MPIIFHRHAFLFGGVSRKCVNGADSLSAQFSFTHYLVWRTWAWQTCVVIDDVCVMDDMVQFIFQMVISFLAVWFEIAGSMP